MTASIAKQPILAARTARNALDLSVKSWVAIALIGQWAFTFYLLVIYVISSSFGLDPVDFSPAPSIRSDDATVRSVFFVHVIPAIYLSFFGLLQLVPKIRNRYRNFHRWNGRIFLALGMSGAITGLFLQWSKGDETNTAASLGITFNGLLIVGAVVMAWLTAIRKRFDLHRRWAVHAFILINGVWTFRLYLMGWYMVNQGPNGNTRNIDGPMDIFLSFACYLLPMVLAEIYFWLDKETSNKRLWGATAFMSIGAIITLIGVAAAIMMMWTPRILKVFAAV